MEKIVNYNMAINVEHTAIDNVTRNIEDLINHYSVTIIKKQQKIYIIIIGSCDKLEK